MASSNNSGSLTLPMAVVRPTPPAEDPTEDVRGGRVAMVASGVAMVPALVVVGVVVGEERGAGARESCWLLVAVAERG
jgi:hypothetical protein